MSVLLVSALPQMRRQWLDLRAERTAREIAQGWRTARILAVTEGRQVDWQRPRVLPEGVAVSVRQESREVERVGFFPDGTAAATICTVSAAGTAAAYEITLEKMGTVLFVRDGPAKLRTVPVFPRR